MSLGRIKYLVSYLKEGLSVDESLVGNIANRVYSELDQDTLDSYYETFSYEFEEDEEEVPDEDSEEFKDYLMQELKYKIESYMDNFEVSGDTITVYRGVALPELKHLRTEGLGIYWAYHREGATDEYNYTGEYKDKKTELYILTGETDIKNIDIEATLNLAGSYSDDYSEDEVRLLPKSPVKIKSIGKYKNGYMEVESNIVGKTFLA